MEALSSYPDAVVAACSAAGSTRTDGQELDNTSNAASCSLTIAPGAVLIAVALAVLKSVCFPGKRRALYSGSEDAPELEEIATTGDRSAKRVDSYHTKSGRLTAAPISPTRLGSVDAKAKSSKRTRGRASETELEPVLWSRNSIR